MHTRDYVSGTQVMIAVVCRVFYLCYTGDSICSTQGWYLWYTGRGVCCMQEIVSVVHRG